MALSSALHYYHRSIGEDVFEEAWKRPVGRSSIDATRFEVHFRAAGHQRCHQFAPTMDAKAFRKEIRQIINDRITAVAADLHERGRRWADMFAEEDARAIETLTIETYGESDQEAAVREEQRKEKDRKRIDLITALSRDKKSEVSQVVVREVKETAPLLDEKAEVVPDDPKPEPKPPEQPPDPVAEPAVSTAKNEEVPQKQDETLCSVNDRGFQQMFYERPNRWHPHSHRHFMHDSDYRRSHPYRSWGWRDRGGGGSRFNRHFHDRRQWTDNSRRRGDMPRFHGDRQRWSNRGDMVENRYSRRSPPRDRLGWEWRLSDRYRTKD